MPAKRKPGPETECAENAQAFTGEPGHEALWRRIGGALGRARFDYALGLAREDAQDIERRGERITSRGALLTMRCKIVADDLGIDLGLGDRKATG